MRKRWKILIGLAGGAVLAALVPIAYVETQCRAPPPGFDAGAPFRSRLPGAAGRRPEAQTWLTYPEWSIVYSAETYGRYLAAGNRPSGFRPLAPDHRLLVGPVRGQPGERRRGRIGRL